MTLSAIAPVFHDVPNRGPTFGRRYTPLSAVNIFVGTRLVRLPQRRHLPLPLSAGAECSCASAEGYGNEDDAAVIKVFPGIDLPQPAAGVTAKPDEQAKPA
jgi:hypothetical protein